MECPHCNREIPGKECPDCGIIIPAESLFCMNCGLDIGNKSEAAEDQSEFDPDNRVLCSDGSCTGIIIDGNCSECGKPVEE